MKQKANNFFRGFLDGIPICLGYVSVSFAFGLMVVENGLPLWIAMLISMTNLTSAGQFAGTALLLCAAPFTEIALTTLIINIRYTLMSLSLSQRIDPGMNGLQRAALSFGVTDEIFAVAMQQKGEVKPGYFAGLITSPYIGWAAGTFLGGAASGILPLSLRSALGIAIYGMFIAIIIPPAKKSRAVVFTIITAAALSCAFKWLPLLSELSSGWVIIICAVVVSALAALFFPIPDDEKEDIRREEESA